MMKLLNNLILSVLLAAGLAVSAGAKAQAPAAFSQAELDQMLAPIALYPDTVLSHVLIAATYPLEVVQAARWSRQNPGLRGEEAVYAVEHMDWDASVKALVAFPDLLQRLDEDLAWTQDLGDAFLLHEEQVLDTVQYLREEAYAHGHLRSNEYVRVVREPQYIYIEPATPRVVYVPYYDPRVVYAHWRWPAYPPVYWHHPPGFRVSVGFHWGIGFHVAPAHFYFSSFHWPRRQLVVVHHHHHHHRPRKVFHSSREVARHDGASRWQHDPRHRRGVNYREGVNEQRFARRTSEAAQARAATRTEQSRTAQRGRTADSRTARSSNESVGTARESRRAEVTRNPQSTGGNVAARSRGGDSGAVAQRRAAQNQPNAAAQRQALQRGNETRSTPSASAARTESARNRPQASDRAETARPEQRRVQPATRSGANTRPAASARTQSGASVERAARDRSSAAPAPSPAQARQPANAQRSAPSRSAQPRQPATTQSSAPARSAPTRQATQPQRPAQTERGRSARPAEPAQRGANRRD